MARLARVVALDTPHHVTQRGNALQYILETDTDRLVYLDLPRASSAACTVFPYSDIALCPTTCT